MCFEGEGAEARGELRFHMVHGWRLDAAGATFVVEAGDGPPSEAAGDDEGEVRQVGGDVQGEAVEGDPLAHADAHGGDLCGARVDALGMVGVVEARAAGGVEWIDPDAGGGGIAACVDAEVEAGFDDGAFEESDVVVDAQPEAFEVEDGIGDELARAVVGDVAAAVSFFEGDALGLEEIGGGEQVLAGGGTSGDGDDGIVLDEEDFAQERGAGLA